MFTINKLWQLLTFNLKINFFILILIGFLSSFFEIFSLSLIFTILAGMIDNTIEFGNIFIIDYLAKFFKSNDFNLINIFTIFLFVYTIKFILVAFNIYFQNRTVFSFLNYLINKLFHKYLISKMIKIKKKNTSEIIRNLNEEVSQVALGLMNSICTFLIELIMLIGLVYLLFQTQSLTSISILFLIILLGFLISFFLKKKIYVMAKNRQTFNYLKYNHIKQSFLGIKDVKIFSAENIVLSNLKKIISKLAKTNIFMNFSTSIPRHIIEYFLILSLILIVLVLNKKGFRSEEIFSSLAFLSIILVKSLPVLNKLINSFINFSSFTPSLNLVFDEIENFRPDTKNTKIKKLKLNKSISLNNIYFKYDDKKVFNNFSLKINKGEVLGVVGKSGSGKSTLVEIIMGLIKPDSGDVIIDDTKLNGREDAWIKNVGYVPQNVYLNSDKIINNIAFGTEENKINHKKVIFAAKSSLISEFIDKLPKKYEQDLGENAQLVSGGQRQRLGIARTIYKDCDLLILDEATNSLDKNTEDELLKIIINLKMNKTIIIISHNDNIKKYCDRVIDIEKDNFK